MSILENSRDIKLMLAIPSGDDWNAAFGVSVAGLVSKYMTYKVHKSVKSQSLEIVNIRSSMLSQSREILLQKAFDLECTHILWLDSDMKFPDNLLHILFRHDHTFIGTNCVRKTIPAEPTSVDLNGMTVYTDWDNDNLEEVGHTGLAVALLKLEDLKDMKPPFFKMEWSDELQCYAGEDVFFCHKLRAEGIPIYVDQMASRDIGHMGIFKYDHSVVGDVYTEPEQEEPRIIQNA